MIRKLTLKRFLVHSDLTLDFSKGLTAITGPNASGKSTILMAIRYALFGTAALNGKAEDVKGSEVGLEFRVRGADYILTRTVSGAKLTDSEGDVLAVGTKPVNAKIVGLFGYGLDVFDVAHCANQGEIEALSAMRPADRKRLIDTTVGLGIIEELEKWCASEASGLEREADAIKRALIAVPDLPPLPTDPRSLVDLVKREEALRELRIRRERLLAQVDVTVSDPGEQPTPPFDKSEYDQALVNRKTVTTLAVEAEAYLAECVRIADKLRAISRLDELRNLPRRDVEAALELANVAAWLEENPPPQWTHKYLDEQETLHEFAYNWDRWHDLKSKGEHICPACSYAWPIEAEAMKDFGEWGDQPRPEPALSLMEIKRGRAEIKAFERIREKHEAMQTQFASTRLTNPALPVCKPADVSRELDYRILNDREFDFSMRRTDALARLGEIADPNPIITNWEDYKRRHELWNALKTDYDQRSAQRAQAQAELASLSDPTEELANLSGLIAEKRAYLAAAAAREPLVEARAKQDAELGSIETRSADYKAARKALGALRAQVKSYLTPSLSKAASALLSRMTLGSRTNLVVTDDFEVTVDGQSINTLSGSEKAAANLALRIGLGQVLTNRVFPVFMADEPDAAMDQNRAAATAEAFDALKPLLGQIVLVSHKRPTADAYVELDSLIAA